MDGIVVLARCAESGLGAPNALTKQSVPFRVYQKAGSCNSSSRGLHTLAQLPARSVRMLDHNAGDECSAYLQYLHDEYERLPAVVVFLQYSGENQLMLPSVASTARLAINAVSRLGGFVPLGRHTFEGSWPAPCEAAGKQSTFRRCSEQIWRHDLGVEPPQFFRFYANGLFAVSRARIRSRSREWYGAMLERLSGRAPARCDGADTRRLPGANSRLVGDCHVLEKAWHVLFGEQPTLPPASEYDAMRAPNSTLRLGGRFYEKTPRGACTAGVPPGKA